MTNPTFTNINRLFALSFKADEIDSTRNSFDKCYMSLVEIKDFNVLIDNKPFSITTLKSNKKRMSKEVLHKKEQQQSRFY